jgi:hypothetical protein
MYDSLQNSIKPYCTTQVKVATNNIFLNKVTNQQLHSGHNDQNNLREYPSARRKSNAPKKMQPNKKYFSVLSKSTTSTRSAAISSVANPAKHCEFMINYS